jgi:NadR type nicotinamide-nucleotide adenylyltransferase
MGQFCPLHQGHLDLILRAKKENDLCLVAVLDGECPDPRFPLSRRTQLVREFFLNDRHVQVIGIPSLSLPSGHSPEASRWREILASIRREADIMTAPITIYTANPAQVDPLVQIGERPLLVPKEQPLQSAEILRNPLHHWQRIATTFRPYLTCNLLVVGTASEGKTSLVNDVARYFNLPTAVEWGRVYMEQHGLRDPELTVDDFVEFLVGQMRLCQQAIRQASQGIMLSDTDNLITLMYAKAYAEDEHMLLSMKDYDEVLYPLARSLSGQIQWHRIFLMQPGGTYVDDGLRYMGQSSMDQRLANHHKLLALLHEFGLDDRVELLQGGNYLQNFLTLKNYIRDLLHQ